MQKYQSQGQLLILKHNRTFFLGHPVLLYRKFGWDKYCFLDRNIAPDGTASQVDDHSEQYPASIAIDGSKNE